jgi:hypothetical protein
MIALAIRRADHLDRPDRLARIVTPHGVILCERAVGGIAINPRLPADFDQTPNDDRPASHLKFWHRPYIITATIAGFDRFYSDRRDQWADQGRVWWRDQGRPAWLKAWPAGTCYTVRCLDGGAWDRSTNRGSYGSLSDALAAAGGRHA